MAPQRSCYSILTPVCAWGEPLGFRKQQENLESSLESCHVWPLDSWTCEQRFIDPTHGHWTRLKSYQQMKLCEGMPCLKLIKQSRGSAVYTFLKSWTCCVRRLQLKSYKWGHQNLLFGFCLGSGKIVFPLFRYLSLSKMRKVLFDDFAIGNTKISILINTACHMHFLSQKIESDLVHFNCF